MRQGTNKIENTKYPRFLTSLKIQTMEQLPFQKKSGEQCCENNSKPQKHSLLNKHHTPFQEASRKKCPERIRVCEPSHEELCKNPLVRWFYLGRASRQRHSQASAI